MHSSKGIQDEDYYNVCYTSNDDHNTIFPTFLFYHGFHNPSYEIYLCMIMVINIEIVEEIM